MWTQEAIHLIESGSIEKTAQFLMSYYDQAYLHSQERHPRVHTVVAAEDLLATI